MDWQIGIAIRSLPPPGEVGSRTNPQGQPASSEPSAWAVDHPTPGRQTPDDCEIRNVNIQWSSRGL
jgi:hypothetical protein